MQWFDCNWSQSDYGWNIYVLWMKIIKRRPTKKIHSDVCDTHMPRQQSQQKMDCVYCTYWRMTKETLKVAVIAVNTQHGVFRVSYITPRYFLLFFTFSPSHIFLYIFFTYAKCQLSISFRTPNNKIGIVMIYYTCTSTHHRSITFSRFLLFFFFTFSRVLLNCIYTCCYTTDKFRFRNTIFTNKKHQKYWKIPRNTLESDWNEKKPQMQ